MNWLNRRAILYKRISDEDQSSYSLDDQQDRLYKENRKQSYLRTMGVSKRTPDIIPLLQFIQKLAA